jgi:glycosyltransferase involved in cell wall biosynthesis
MNGTTVACIIPHYCQLDTLRRAVSSALAQCDEVIVVDDATSREIGDVRDVIWDMYAAQHTLPRRLKLWLSGANHGVCETRNTGALFTECDYLLPLDADDWLVPGAVSYFKPYLAGNAFVYGDWFDEPNGVYRSAAPLAKLQDKNVAKATFFISRAQFNVVGGYDTDFEGIGAEDWALMRALARVGKGLKVSAPIYHYSVHEGGRSALPMQHEQQVRELMAAKFEASYATSKHFQRAARASD